ncbi:NAD-dependent epimerase/dehydratase family protein [Actinoplanes sp. CA-030573]|uniref:NAD-dependent epimerase/dehydratase family protein n=1 Tax=Actinoplanes sp. CA-030573 TaxID=3239898 RepID=UPI003D93E76E
MRIVLAGGTGAIGRVLVPALLAQGHEVTVLVRGERTVPGATVVVADLYDRDGLTAVVRAAEPEVVMHQLTNLSAGSTPAANGEFRKVVTPNLVHAAMAAGASRVIAQSIAFAYEPGDVPATEETGLDRGAAQPRLASVEGVAALEEAVRQAPEWVLLRYGLFYGPGTWYARDGLMAQPGSLVNNGDVASFVHVEDAAAAAVASLSWPTGAVNVCDDEPAPAHEWVPAFCEAVGAPVPPAVDGRAPWARGASNRHAREDLGWTPRHASWRTGFREL